MQIPYTPFALLQEGDEFVRIAGRAVLIRDIEGVREGSWFTVSFTSRAEQNTTFKIRRMFRYPSGHLDERFVDELEAI